MAAQLPLKIRVDVRDQFEKPESALQQAFGKIKEIVGYPVSCNVDWPMLWGELEKAFKDKEQFTPYVVGILISWCNALSLRLADEDLEEWNEELLDKLATAQRIEVSVQACDGSRPCTKLISKPAFVVEIPKTSNLGSTNVTHYFLDDLSSLFSPQNTSRAAPSTNDDDDWASIPTPSTSTTTSHRLPTHTPSRSFSLATEPEVVSLRPTPLPTLQSLPRPDVLFSSSPPYIIHLRAELSSQKLVIQGTHEPSLKVLCEYFQRWTRRNTQDVRDVSLLRYTLAPSNLGPGTWNDTLIIEPFSQMSGRFGANVNPALVQVFIERHLGYQLTATNASSTYWEYRRTVPFL